MTAVELTDCPPHAPELPRGLAAASAIGRTAVPRGLRPRVPSARGWGFRWQDVGDYSVTPVFLPIFGRIFAAPSDGLPTPLSIDTVSAFNDEASAAPRTRGSAWKRDTLDGMRASRPRGAENRLPRTPHSRARLGARILQTPSRRYAGYAGLRLAIFVAIRTACRITHKAVRSGNLQSPVMGRRLRRVGAGTLWPIPDAARRLLRQID